MSDTNGSPKSKKPSDPATGTGGARNPADFVIGSQVARALEGTQINKFHTRGGAGFAAEEANGLQDKLAGARVEQVGGTNELNGPDRIVNGVPIQTKYYDNPRATLNSAFDAGGNYKYGHQMLEVPNDQYDDCRARMKVKIRRGMVPGVSDPAEAESIIKRGDATYKQAKNIAAAGNIDSVWFDIQNQCVTSAYALAISFAINFAKQKWDGKETNEATKGAILLGLQSGGTALVTNVVTAQLLRVGAADVGVVAVQSGVRTIAQTQVGRGIVSSVASASLGKSVYGAAATNYVAKLLRTNAITGVVVTVVVSAPDFYRATFHGSISWVQLSKNVVVNGTGVAGGVGGWMAGAAGGAAVGTAVPVIGTAIGAFVGGVLGALAGGTAASGATKYVLDGLVEDDAKEMLRLLADYLVPDAGDYLLSESETKELVAAVKEKVSGKFLREMYASSNRREFVSGHFVPVAEQIIRRRVKVLLPKPTELEAVLEEIKREIDVSAD